MTATTPELLMLCVTAVVITAIVAYTIWRVGAGEEAVAALRLRKDMKAVSDEWAAWKDGA